MKVATKTIAFSTKGNCHIINITEKVQKELEHSNLKQGLINISAIGSTAGITTCEFESGMVKDLKEFFQKAIPEGKGYHHDATWGDANGHSHLRASLLGPSLTVSFEAKKLILGTWQQIIFIDFDNRPRNRKVSLQFIGE